MFYVVFFSGTYAENTSKRHNAIWSYLCEIVSIELNDIINVLFNFIYNTWVYYFYLNYENYLNSCMESW